MKTHVFAVLACAVVIPVITFAQAGGDGGSGTRMPEPHAQPQKRISDQQPPETPEKPYDPLIEPDPAAPVLNPWYDLKQTLKRDARLDINTYYTAVYQHATDTFSGQDNLLNGRYDLNLNWTAIDWGHNTTSFGALMRSGQNIGIDQDYALGPDVGDDLGINSLQGNSSQQSITLNMLYLRQSFFENKLAIYVGKIHPNQHIDLSMVANDESTQFLSGCFDGTSSNPVEGAYTPGVTAEYQVAADVHLNALIVDSQGKPQTGLNTLDEGRFYEALELGYQPDVKDSGKGNYRLIGWHNDRHDGEDGFGIATILEQEIGGGWVPSLRVGYGDPKLTAIEQNVALALANTQPFGRRGDMWGIGLAWGKSSNDSFRDQVMLETFYRIKVTKSFEFSPDIELLMPPADPAANDVIAIFGLRLRAVF